MTETNPIPRSQRQQAIYWRLLLHLKTVATYIRLYRDDQARWIRRFGILRGVAGSGTVAGWLLWKDYAIVWASVIGASQLAEALKDHMPNARRQKAATELAAVLEALFLDAQVEWERLTSGTATDCDVMASYRKFAALRIEAEKKYFPEGTPRNARLYVLADKEAGDYMDFTYGKDTLT